MHFRSLEAKPIPRRGRSSWGGPLPSRTMPPAGSPAWPPTPLPQPSRIRFAACGILDCCFVFIRRRLVMYSGVVHRTQVYLDDAEVEALDAASTRTGASRSELIRRAIRAQYGQQSRDARASALRSSAGTWQGRSWTGAQYVEGIRGDVNERLARLRSS
jgi:hypothetical protein